MKKLGQKNIERELMIEKEKEKNVYYTKVDIILKNIKKMIYKRLMGRKGGI